MFKNGKKFLIRTLNQDHWHTVQILGPATLISIPFPQSKS